MDRATPTRRLLSRRRVLAGLAAAPLLVAASTRVASTDPRRQPPGRPARVLVVTATAGYRHDSIQTAQRVLEELAARSGDLTVDMTLGDVEALTFLNAATLAEHDVLCFANTSGELPLDDGQKQAIVDFVAGGKGFVGTHSATDTFYDWPAYGEMVGAYFKSHPWVQPVNVVVEDATHPTVRDLGDAFQINEEIYTFRDNPRSRAQIVLRLDETSVNTPGDYPLAWYRSFGSGRVYYNALGHFVATWEDLRFQSQLLGGLRWAAGLETPSR